MKQTITRALGLVLVMTLLCGFLYTVVCTGINQVLFPKQANGSVIEIDGKKIKTNDMVKEIIANSKGKELDFTINRDYEIINEKITPEYVNGKYTAGIWIKDSCAGIGTITYYDKGSNTFACLGHGICDKDSSTLLPMAEGDICPAIIESIEKGKDDESMEISAY